jgi:hypothetical protein
MAERWKYKIFTLEVSEEPASSQDQLRAQYETFMEQLNDFGAHGWEAVGQITVTTETQYAGEGGGVKTEAANVLLFKRSLDS